MKIPVSLNVNGTSYAVLVEPEQSLADTLRVDLGLPGTKRACNEGECGSCTVLLDGESVRSCLLLAVAVEGHEITTIEGLAQHPAFPALYRAFTEHHALQCGFCTPGIVASTIAEIIGRVKSEEEIVDVLSGHLCRCTGYIGLKDALRELAQAEQPQGNTPT